MNTAVMFSSATDLWATPQWLFDDFNAEFGFTLDACALPSNAKCAKYFTPEVDGLAQDWDGEVVWCNPPYGREIGKWVKKCAEESKKTTQRSWHYCQRAQTHGGFTSISTTRPRWCFCAGD